MKMCDACSGAPALIFLFLRPHRRPREERTRAAQVRSIIARVGKRPAGEQQDIYGNQ
jgi:hypothetical protein